MKTTLLLCACLINRIVLPAQVAGPNNASSFSNADLPGYSQQWTNVNNAQSDDENYATFGNLPGAAGSYTDYMVVTDFGFTIPAGTIINGIKVEVNCSDPNTHTSDFSVRIIKTGNISGTNKAAGTPYSVSDSYMVYGGSTDLWGETWDYKFIDDNKFGVAIAAQRNTSDDITTDGRVDNIRITVYYTFISLPVNLISFTATKENKSILLKWNTADETSMNNYQIERSFNGINFYSLGIVPCRNQTSSKYLYADSTPLSGLSYYRLRMEGAGGYQKYSPVVSVHFDKHVLTSLFPSPWTKGSSLFINNPGKQVLRIFFYNASGQLISNAVTSSANVPTNHLSGYKGKFYYNVLNTNGGLVGSGTFMIQ